MGSPADRSRKATTRSRLKRSLARIVVAALAATGASLGAVAPAAAAPPEAETVNHPTGVTMDLFDYWVTGDQDTPDNVSAGCDPEYYTSGINGAPAGSDFEDTGHVLKFGKDLKWTACSANDLGVYNTLSINKTIPNGGTGNIQDVGTGVVEDELSSHSIPVIKGMADKYDDYPSESLNYLFDPTVDNPGKAAYPVTNPNLFSYDFDTGYLSYDSMENYAWFDEDAGEFEVYDRPSEMVPSGSSQSRGQFFPFVGPDVAFDADGNPNRMSVEDEALNHYFGMNMRATFYQPPGGQVEAPNGELQDMIFEFSGDDDVWVFIDGRLAMDLGGTHGIAHGSINFATGEVTTGLDGGTQSTHLLPGWGTGDFAENSYHELSFFYLERGNYVSNMSIEFNLNTVPVSTTHKTTQDGRPLPGATFDLYNTDEDYAVDEDAPLCSDSATAPCRVGEFTSSSSPGHEGNFEFIDADGNLVDFGTYPTEHFVLRETSAPAGYSMLSEDVKIEYTEVSDGVSSSGVLEVVNYAETGVWISFDSWVRPLSNIMDVVTDAGDSVGQLELRDVTANNPTDGGNGLYAVLTTIDADGNYYTVAGNHADGWTNADGGYEPASSARLTTDGDGVITGGLEGARVQWLHPDSGTYRGELEDLPGLLREYRTPQIEPRAEADERYVIQFYYQDGDTTRLLDTADFQRRRVSNVTIPNPLEQVELLKQDTAGNPLAGAGFTLYARTECASETSWRQASVEVVTGSDGLASLSPEDLAAYPVPADCVRTGAFELRESTTPAGYDVSPNIPLVVDGHGIHIDAGDETSDPLESIVVEHRLQRVTESLVGRAMNDLMTRQSELADLSAVTMRTVSSADPADLADGTTVDETEAVYDGEAGPGAYVAAEGGGQVMHRVTSGYSDAQIFPVRDTGNITTATDISASYSIAQRIVVVDHRDALVFSKHVEQPVADLDADVKERDFEFTVTVDGAGTNEYLVVIEETATGAEVSRDSVQFTDGSATITLKDGQQARVYDLPLGADYTITESGPAAGYGPTDPSTGEAAGTLPGDPEADPAAEEFVNAYSSTTEFTIEASKTLTGQALDAGAYDFVVTPVGSDVVLATGTNAAAEPGAPGGITFDADPAEDGDQPFAFTTAELLQAVEDGWATRDGNVFTLNLQIMEDTTGLDPGVSPGLTHINFQVTVTDHLDGTATANVVYPEGADGLDLTNSYNTNDVDVPFYGFKELVNAPGTTVTLEDLAGLFTFTLSPSGDHAEDAPMPEGATGEGAERVLTVTNDSTGLADFGSALFTQELLDGVEAGEDGTRSRVFEYEITESGAAPGVVNDATATKTFTVTLIDDGAGHLLVAPSAEPGFVHVNTYEVQPEAVAGLSAAKALTGRDWQEGETYTFLLEATGAGTEQTPMPEGTVDGVASAVATAGTPQAEFGGITYTRPGTYTYRLWEEVPAENPSNGVTYSAAQYTVTVTVVDNGDGTMGVTRVMHQVVDDDGAAVDPPEVVETDDAAAFENSYAATPTVESGFTATKELSGREWNPEETFTFELRPTGDNAETAPMPSGTPASPRLITVTATEEDQSPQFGSIVYAGPGTWTYQIRELAPSLVDEGMTYSAAVYDVEVTVTDDGQGGLDVARTVTQTTDDAGDDTGTTADAAVFANTYAEPAPTPTRVSVPVAKDVEDLDGDDAWNGDHEFTFELRVADGSPEGTPLPEDAENGVATVSVTADRPGGSFGQIEFSEPGTYTYLLTEQIPEPTVEGLTYSQAEYLVEVVVTVNEANELVASTTSTQTTSDDGSAGHDEPVVSPVFTNTFVEPVPGEAVASIPVEKVLEGRDWAAEDEFVFSLVPVGDQAGSAPMPEGATGDGATVTATSDEPVVEFGEFVFDAEGVWTYRITEQVPEDPVAGLSYSQAVYDVTVTVAPGDSGDLVASVETVRVVDDAGSESGEAAESAVFTNTFVEPVPGEAVASIPVEKVLEGRDWSGSDLFLVDLVATGENAESAPMPDGAVAGTASVTLTSAGPTGWFGPMNYNEPGVWTYRITEQVPEDPVAGLSYSQAVYDVTVTVAPGDSGDLVASVETVRVVDDAGSESGDAAESAVFTNTFVEPSPSPSEPTTTPPTDPGTPEPSASEPGTPEPSASEPNTSEPSASGPGQPTHPAGEMPNTGSETLSWVLGALALLLIGGVLVAVSRRRRQH